MTIILIVIWTKDYDINELPISPIKQWTIARLSDLHILPLSIWLEFSNNFMAIFKLMGNIG